jgi:hypothetical protein
MYYNYLTSDVWEQLSQKSATNPDMVVCMQILSNTDEDNPFFCIFVSSDDSLHFLCEFNEENNNFEMINPNVAGLELKVIKNHFILNRERQNYYDLRCTGNHHKEEFTNMIKEICDLVFTAKYSIPKAIITVIRRRTSFWGRPKNTLLNEEIQRGLFGELYVLNELIELGIEEAVQSWTGPLQSKHDFYFTEFSLEVKTTVGSRHKHIINGLEQLEQDDEKELLIVSLKIKNSEDGKSISHFVHKIRQKMSHRPDLIEEFNRLIESLGYKDIHEDYYMCYILEGDAVFPVSEGFPTFTNKCLNESLPARISKINYTLDMEGLYCFKLTDKKFWEYCKS